MARNNVQGELLASCSPQIPRVELILHPPRESIQRLLDTNHKRSLNLRN